MTSESDFDILLDLQPCIHNSICIFVYTMKEDKQMFRVRKSRGFISFEAFFEIKDMLPKETFSTRYFRVVSKLYVQFKKSPYKVYPIL